MKSLARALGLVLVSLAVVPGCGSDATGPGPSPVLGPWGAEGVGLVLTADGGHLASVCSEGWIDEPVRLDVLGRFRVQGSYAEGPVPVIRAAEFSGRITGDLMQLSIFDSETGSLRESFTLRRGVEWGDTPLCVKGPAPGDG